jgi:hypothetical protein
MRVRRLPVRPDLEQLHRQAKELLRGIRAGDADAIAELREHHPESIDPSSAKLADAQLVLARSYRIGICCHPVGRRSRSTGQVISVFERRPARRLFLHRRGASASCRSGRRAG